MGKLRRLWKCMDESRKNLTKFIFQHTNIRETTLVNIGLDDVFKTNIEVHYLSLKSFCW